MATLTLGTISPGKISLFNVQATSKQSGIIFAYKYKSGKLPQGLTIQPNGEVEGVVSNEYFELDGGATKLDVVSSKETTTLDHEYIFTVTATGSDTALTTSNQQFKIKLSTPYTKGYNDVFAEAGLDLTQRNRFIAQYSDNNIFPNDKLYRPEDKNFGIAKDLKMLLISGLETSYLSEYMSTMQRNFANKTVYFGDLATAKATNSAGTTIYEVLYYPVVDEIKGISTSQDIGDETDIPFRVTDLIRASASLYTADQSQYDTVYPNSLTNMRSKLDNLGQVTGEFLPLWMRSVQTTGNALGWTPAVPIAYCQPGESAQLKYNIEKRGIDIKSLPFTFFEIFTMDHLGTTIDATPQSVTKTGDATTREFQITNFLNNDSTTVNHTISTNKSVRVTIDGVTQDDRRGTVISATSDSNLIQTDASIFYGSADGKFLDIVYHAGVETGGDATDVSADSLLITADGNNQRSTTITFARPPATDANIVILRKQNIGFDTKSNSSFDGLERTQTDISNGGDGSTLSFTIFFEPKSKPTVKIGDIATTTFTINKTRITFTTAPRGYLADTTNITTDGAANSNFNNEQNITADSTGANISVSGIPAQTTFDGSGTTFGDHNITFDIGRNSTRTLPIPMRDLTHLQGDAIRRYEQLVV